MNQSKTPITVAKGDGIGPEIMDAALHVLKEGGAELEIHEVDIGERVYLKGFKAGIEPKTWDTIRNTKAFLKAPITTPQGGGFKSLNVTIRTTLGLYANIRPCVSYAPFIATKHPKLDVVIVRENEEDLYTGIEYRQTPESYHALKMITRPACEKIVRYAFEYAKAYDRKKVTCFTKDNILKMSDGLFHKVFDEIAVEYPEIKNEHWIIDIGSAKLAATPELFDVIVLPNLYGDILSDVGAQLVGSVGLVGSANIGENGAMFEAIHGSAPSHAGQDSANPSALLLASVMMLVHLGQTKTAEEIHNAWLKTIEDGVHTYDIFTKGVSKKLVGTKEFAGEVVKRLGQKPETLKSASYAKPRKITAKLSPKDIEESKKAKEMVGVDVFIQSRESPEYIQKQLSQLKIQDINLTLIANRGSRVWPEGFPETSCVDSWRCRFMSKVKNKPVTHLQIASLLSKMAEACIDYTQVQTLCTFAGEAGYTVAQEEQ